MSTVSHILPPDATESAPPSAAISARRPGILSVYLALMKPKIILLLLITTIGAMFVAAGGAPDLNLLLWTIIGGALSAGGANALNHYFDRDIDGFMYRTKRRPLPAGWVQPGRVIAFGISLCALAFLVFSTQVNLLAAVLSLDWRPLLHLHLHPLAQTPHTAQHHTIGGVAGPSRRWWAGRRDRQAGSHRLGAVRHRLLVDSAPHLGAHPHGAARLRPRGRAHAAGCGDEESHLSPESSSTRGATSSSCWPSPRLAPAGSTSWRRWRSASSTWATPIASAANAPMPPPGASTNSRCCNWRCFSSPW
ncbi:MAG: UbiA family prenyltransferase [Caldilineales bacterium]|nr:UbiA family prenyltransferase [Caldilineales bacterium]